MIRFRNGAGEDCLERPEDVITAYRALLRAGEEEDAATRVTDWEWLSMTRWGGRGEIREAGMTTVETEDVWFEDAANNVDPMQPVFACPLGYDVCKWNSKAMAETEAEWSYLQHLRQKGEQEAAQADRSKRVHPGPRMMTQVDRDHGQREYHAHERALQRGGHSPDPARHGRETLAQQQGQQGRVWMRTGKGRGRGRGGYALTNG